jgi:hypothetical protein
MAIAQVGSGVAAAGNGYAQYNAALGQSKYAASALNQNAMLAGMQSDQVTKRAEFETALRGKQAAQEIGHARAYTSGAVDVNTGSAANVQEDIAAAAAADQANIRQNAALQRWGYGIEAANYHAQSRLAKAGGRFAANSSLISGGQAFARDMMGAGYYGKQAGWFDGKPGAGGTDPGYKATNEWWNGKELD